MLIDNITIDYKFRPYPEVEIRHLNENYCGQLVLLNFYIIDEKTNHPVKISGQHWRVSFAAKGLKPFTNVYVYIGSTDVNANTEPAKKLVFSAANGAFQEG